MEDQGTKPDPMVSLKAMFRDYLATNPIQSVWERIRQLGVQLWIVIKGLTQVTRLLIVLMFNLAGFLLWLAGFVALATVTGVAGVIATVWVLWMWMLMAIVVGPLLYLVYGLFQMWLERQGP